MANYYKKDPKTGKWVVDEEMQKVAQTSAAKKASAGSATSKSTGSSGVSDIDPYKSDLDWESYVAQQNAGFAARDVYNAGLQARKSGTFIDQNTYKLGGSDKIRSEQGMYGIKEAGMQLPDKASWQAASPAGYTDADTDALVSQIGDTEDFIDYYWKKSMARLGDESWKEDETLTKEQKDEYARMNKLHGVDQYYGVQQGDVKIKPPQLVYSEDEYRDWEARYLAGDPTAYPEYVQRALGDVGASYQEAQDVIGAHGELDENSAAKQDRESGFYTKNSDISEDIRSRDDFAEKSQYIPDNQYGQQNITDMWFNSGYGSITVKDENGKEFNITADQYRDMAANSLIYDWVTYGNDPDKRQELEFRTAQLGDAVGGYFGHILDAIPEITEKEAEVFRYLYNDGTIFDRSEAMKYLHDTPIRKRYTESEMEELQKKLESGNFLTQAGLFAKSVPQSVMNMIVGNGQALRDTGLLDGVVDWINEKTGYEDYDTQDEYSLENLYGKKSSLTRGYQGGWLEEHTDGWEVPGLGWNIPKMAYNALGSGLDQALVAFLSSGTTGALPTLKIGGKVFDLAKYVGPLFMAGGSYINQRNESLAAGRGEENAKRDAAAAYGFEALSELGPFGKIVGDGGINSAKRLLASMGEEFLGAFTGNLGYAAYDTIAYGNQSEVGQEYNKLVTEGYDPTKSKFKAVGSALNESLEGAFTEAFSAGVHTGLPAIADYSGMKAQGNAIQDAGDLQGFVDVAKTLGLEGDAAQALADLDAQLQAEKGETAAPEADTLTDKEFEENFSEDLAEEAPAQIDAQGVVDAVMADVSGQIEGDVSAAVETAVEDAIDFIAEEANENGGENSEGVIDTAMMVAENAMGDVSAQDAQKLKNSIRTALSNAYDTFKAEGGRMAESAKQKNANKAEAEARAEEQRQAEADKAARREAEMKKKATEQAWKEVRAAAENAGKTADELFDLASRRAGDILYEMRQKAADAVKSHAEAEAAKQAEQNQREQDERADEGKREDTSDFVAPQEWREAEQNMREREERSEKSKETLELDDADAVEQAEKNARERAERADVTKDTLDVEDVESVKKAEQTMRNKAERSSKGKRSKVSAAKIGLIYRASMAKLDAQAQEVLSKAYARTLEGQLAEKNITGDAAKTISQQLADMIGGKDTTPYIKNLITNNEAVRQIYLDSMAKVESTNANRGYLMGMGEFGYSPNAVTPTIADEEPGEADEIKIEAKEGDSASDIVAKNAQVYLGEQAATMESMYNAETQDAAEYAEAFVRAANYGKDGRDIDVVLESQKDGGSLSALTTEQVKAAYTIGREMQKNAPTAARKNSKGITVGKVDMRSINMGSLNKHQRASVYTAARLAKAVGFNVRFVESKANARGQYTTENGSWDSRTMTLTLDVHAGSNSVRDTSYAMMHTMGHELTHYIKQFADAALWNDYQSFVMSHLSTKMDNAVLDGKIAKMMQQQKGLTREGAIEEIIADASVEALKNITEADIQKITDTNPGLLKKIANYIQKWVKETKAAIASAYSGTDIKHNAFAKEMTDVLDETSKRWNELLANAAKNRRAEAQGNYDTTAEAAIMEATDGAENADGEKLFSLRTMQEDKADFRQMLIRHGKMSAAQVNELFQTIDRLMEEIEKKRHILDFGADIDSDSRSFTPVKPNSDPLYQVSVDFSTLCRKRLLQQVCQERLEEEMDRAVTKAERVAIRDELIKLQQQGKQIEVACALCYVESARLKSPAQIQRFIDNRANVIREYFARRNEGVKAAMQRAEAEYREANNIGNESLKNLPGSIAKKVRAAKNAPIANYQVSAEEQKTIDKAMSMSVSDFTTADSLWALKHSDPVLFDIYTSYIRNATKSKGIEGDTPWKAGDSKAISDELIRKMNEENGLRSQSWSDFQTYHILDYIASIIELSTRNAKMQAYSKVPAYVKLMGETGVMINMSLIPEAKFDGTLKYDGVEGIIPEEAFELRKRFPDTAGTICIGIDDTQIRMLLENDDIDYVIPYHRSGMDAATRRKMRIPTWKDYEKYQNEKALSKDAGKAPKFSEWFDYETAVYEAEKANNTPEGEAAIANGDVMYGAKIAMQKAAQRYKDLCAARNLAPKFQDFANEAGYWKLLIDRKMINNITGEIIEQKAVQPVFKEGTLIEICKDEVSRFEQNNADFNDAVDAVIEAYKNGTLGKAAKSAKVQQQVKAHEDWVTVQAVIGAQEQVQDGVKYSPRMSETERNRALREGEMVNEFYNALKGDWPAYYDKINNDTAYSPDRFYDGDISYMIIGDKLLILEMQRNGEFSVIDVYKSNAFAYNNGIEYEQFEDLWRENGYGEETFINWITAFANDGGEEVPQRYDRVRKRFVPVERGQKSIRDGNDRIYRSGAQRTGVLETSAEEGKADLKLQQRDLSELSDRELLVQALEGELTEAERDHLNRYKARVDELGEKQMKLEALNAKIVQLKANGATAKTSEELRAAQTNAKTLRDSIARADIKLVSAESTKMFKKIVQRNRDEATFAANERAREMERERRRVAVQDARNRTRKLTTERIHESNDRNKYKEQILADVKKLNGWLISPTSKGSVPQFLRAPVAQFLESIDFRSKKALNAEDVLNSGKAEAASEWLAQAAARRDAAKKRYDEALKAYEAIKNTGTEEEIKKAKSRMNLAKGMYEMEARAVENGLASSANAYTKADDKFVEALEALRDAIGDINKDISKVDDNAKVFAGYIDLPGGFQNDFNDLVRDIKQTLKNSAVTDVPFNKMKSEQLQELSKAIKALNSGISKTNRLIANARYESAKTASNETIDDMNSMTAKVKTNKALAALNSIFNWKNTTPYYAFQRLGRGGKAIFEGLQDGWDKMAHNSAKLIKYAEDTFDGDESKAWGRETDTITLESGETVQMTTAQKMSLYCHSKRAQSVGHLMGGGIRIADIHGKRGSTISQAENYVLTQKDISKIIKSLTARQIEVADALQEFMNTTCKEWGNEISMKRFGFEQMTEENYFPIKTDANNRPNVDESKDGSTSMFRLLNMSSLKPVTPKANNAIIIDNIFDVFSNHAADMAKYNALALPILDFIKWYNYVERTDVVDASGNATGQIKTRSTQKALERAYGNDAKDYLRTFIKDLNAEHDGGRNDYIVMKLLNRAKAASVGANIRVWMLQITSAPRAAYAINAKYLIKAAATRGDGSKAQDAVGILKWKDLGFYSTDMNNSVRDKVKRDGSKFDKLRELQMAPAGWGDTLTANIIYKAAQYEMADKHPELKPGSEVYKTMLNRRVREIVYKTQVVDSTMTRSEHMRSKGVWPLLTSFMSEPTLSVNMLNEGVQQAIMKKRGLEDADLKPGSNIGKAAAAFASTAVFSALVGAIANAFRDDDEYEKFWDKYKDSFWDELRGNFEIWDMLPLAKDVADAVKAYINEKDYAPSTLVTQVLTYLVETATAVKEYREGKRTLTNVIFNGLKTLSYGSGLGAYNLVRDVCAIYNTCIANAVNLPKLQMYVDKEKDASGALYRVAIEGDTEAFEFYADRAELYGITAEDLENDFAKLIGDEFVAGNITEENAVDMLMQYGGKKAKNAESALLTWKYEKETGGKYSNLEEEYTAGTITKQQAIDYLVKYGGKTKEAATKQVNKWAYEEETGSSYDDIRDDYISGAISESQLRKHLAQVEGLDEEKIEDRISQYDYTAYTGKTTSAPKYWRLVYTYETGGNYQAYADQIFDEIMAEGKSWKQARSSIASSLASYYKKDYLAIKGTAQGDKMLEEILDVFEAIGYARSYERDYIAKKWTLDD